MNTINTYPQQYNVSSSGINQEKIKTTLAESKQAVNNNIESNTMTKIISGNTGEDNSRFEAFMLVPILGFIDSCVDKLMGGAEEKSLLKKIANIGDKISDKLHLEQIFKSEKLANGINKIKNSRLFKYSTEKFQAVPRTSFAKRTSLAEAYKGKLPEQTKKLFAKLLNYKDEILTSPGDLKDSTVQILKDLSKENVQNYSTEQMLDVFDDLVANGKNKINIDVISQLKNKIKAANSEMGNSVLGKNLAKGTLKAKDVVTYGGGLISLFFMASALAQAIKATKEAPKGEKKSTFMHVLSEQYLGFILFGPSIQLLYKLGGNKYRGMTEAGREALKTLIEKTNIDENLTKEGLKIAKLQRNLLIKGVDKDKVAELTGKGLKEAKNLAKSLKNEGAKLKWWEKPLKAMGKLLSTGLDKLQKPTFIKLKDGAVKFKLPKPTLKGFAGGLGRFLLIMMVIQPLIQKPLTKLCHKIFGEPKTYLEKQKKENASDKNQPVQNNNEEQNAVSPQPAQTPKVPQQNSSNTNLLDRWSKPQDNSVSVSSSVPQPEQTTKTEQTPAALNLFKKDSDSKRYIPSIEPVVQTEDKEFNAKVAAIIKEDAKLIKQAEKYLN